MPHIIMTKDLEWQKLLIDGDIVVQKPTINALQILNALHNAKIIDLSLQTEFAK